MTDFEIFQREYWEWRLREFPELSAWTAAPGKRDNICEVEASFFVDLHAPMHYNSEEP